MTTTIAPSSAKAMAAARPIPVSPPVIKTTHPTILNSLTTRDRHRPRLMGFGGSYFRDQGVQIHRQPGTSRPEIEVNQSEIVLKSGRSRPMLSPCKRDRPGAILKQRQMVRSIP